MDIFMSNQTLSDNISSKNPGFTGVKGTKLVDPHLKELLQEQDKQICLSRDKSLTNLQQKVFSVYGPLCRIWSVIEEEKEACL